MDRPVRLIVNPSAGAGRAAKLLPDVEAALRSHGIAFRVDRTTSIEHARELARAARDAGEVAAAMGGDGLAGAVAGELCGSDCVMAVVPGGRGNDLARKLGIGHDPVAAVELLAAGRERRIDVAEAGGRVYVGILSAGFDSDVNEIANGTRLTLGTLVYLYGALRALARWKPARWHVTVDGTTHEFDGYAVAVANSGVFGGGMWLVPDAEHRRRPARRRVHRSTSRSSSTCAGSAACSRAPMSGSPGSSSCRAARSPSTPTGRSPPTPTATRSPTCPPRCASGPARCG